MGICGQTISSAGEPSDQTTDHNPPGKPHKAPPPPTFAPKNEPISPKCPTPTGEAKNPTHRKSHKQAKRAHQKGASNASDRTKSPRKGAHQKRDERSEAIEPVTAPRAVTK